MKFKSTFFIIILIVFPFLLIGQMNNTVYKALQSNNLDNIEETISALNNEKSNSINNAYLGALYMKKADFLKDAKTKIATFKKGKNLLEKEIESDPNQVEYIFLRLAIQEHAPKILKYNLNIEADKDLILLNLENLSADLKKVIKKYSETSNILKL